ncbi:MAG: nitrite reductase (NAD(P)H) small subunit [Actinomycetota bacterium]|nr:nitrite reductase (NAD(P)H) small subunit [Actinomycetota bacterium]
MQYYRVLHLDDLHLGQGHRIDLDGHVILLTKLAGTPLAIDDACPRDGASLSAGRIEELPDDGTEAQVGFVTCASDGVRISLHDGSVDGSDDERVPVYATRLTADSWVEVEVPGPGA